jgi:hypothetical protein
VGKACQKGRGQPAWLDPSLHANEGLAGSFSLSFVAGLVLNYPPGIERLKSSNENAANGPKRDTVGRSRTVLHFLTLRLARRPVFDFNDSFLSLCEFAPVLFHQKLRFLDDSVSRFDQAVPLDRFLSMSELVDKF